MSRGSANAGARLRVYVGARRLSGVWGCFGYVRMTRWEVEMEIIGPICDICHVTDDGHAEATNS